MSDFVFPDVATAEAMDAAGYSEVFRAGLISTVSSFVLSSGTNSLILTSWNVAVAKAHTTTGPCSSKNKENPSVFENEAHTLSLKLESLDILPISHFLALSSILHLVTRLVRTLSL